MNSRGRGFQEFNEKLYGFMNSRFFKTRISADTRRYKIEPLKTRLTLIDRECRAFGSQWHAYHRESF